MTRQPSEIRPVGVAPQGKAKPRHELTLLDSTSIIVGVIIGAGLYQNAPLVAASVGSVWELVGVWILGGLLATCGALCYAELAAAYPHDGGDYVYLTRAFGRQMGFVFAWAELWVVRPGSVGFMAFVFARYANILLPLPIESPELATMLYAITAIVLLTGINILGVREGKWTQNVLTAAKVLGLLLVLAIAVVNPAPRVEAPALVGGQTDYKFAMILIMFTYGGWSEVAYVAAEVRDARRNILRALMVGLGAVTAIYILVNLSFVYSLGFDGLRSSKAAAADALQGALGPRGAQLISLLICVSCLGAINGHLFTGARIYYALGQEHVMFRRLGRWSPRFGTPVWSLIVQAAVTLIPLVGFGLMPDSFGRLVLFTTPVFWFFFFLTGCALVVLRRIENLTPRPYKVWAYPWTPLVFCLSSLGMLYSSFAYAIEKHSYEGLWSIIILTLGYILSFYDPRPTRQKAAARKRQRKR